MYTSLPPNITTKTINSAEMVRACLERMQECYAVCNGQAGRIVEAVARHFRQLGQGRVRGAACVEVGRGVGWAFSSSRPFNRTNQKIIQYPPTHPVDG